MFTDRQVLICDARPHACPSGWLNRRVLALLLVPSIVSPESDNCPASTCSYSVMDTVLLCETQINFVHCIHAYM